MGRTSFLQLTDKAMFQFITIVLTLATISAHGEENVENQFDFNITNTDTIASKIEANTRAVEELTCTIQKQNVLSQIQDDKGEICPGWAWAYMNGKCARIMGWARSFGSAKESCESINAKVAEPTTKCDSDLLQYYLQIRGHVNSDGTNVPFHYWSTEQSEVARSRSCVHLHGHNTRGLWHKKSCDSGMLFICEKLLKEF